MQPSYAVLPRLRALDLDTGDWSVTWHDAAPFLRVLAVVALALVARWLIGRAIGRGVERSRARAAQRDADTTAGLSRAERLLAEATGYSTKRQAARTATMGALLRSVTTVVVSSIVILYVMDALGLNLAPLLASAGVGGVALGFGAQSLVKDYLSGIFMSLEDQYGVGDVIDTGEVTGTVEDITLRVTRIRDATGVIWYVRNGEILRIANKSQGWSLAVADVPVAAGEDPERAMAALRSAMHALDEDPEWSGKLLEEPTVAGVESVSAGTMLIRVIAKCAPNENIPVQRVVLERGVVALHQAGLRPPAVPAHGVTGLGGTGTGS